MIVCSFRQEFGWEVYDGNLRPNSGVVDTTKAVTALTRHHPCAYCKGWANPPFIFILA